MGNGRLDLPWFYDPNVAEQLEYRPSPHFLADAAASAFEDERSGGRIVGPSRDDRIKIALLLIDMQIDFCHPAGALPVLGRSGEAAVFDSRRTAEFILREAPRISRIIATADSHHQMQAFFTSAWTLVDTGRMPECHTLIGLDGLDLVNRALDGTVIGAVEPNPGLLQGSRDRNRDWLIGQMKFYVRSLEEAGRPPLYLWPYHCLDGTAGQDIMPIVQEAMLYHGFLRQTSPTIVRKGMHPLTEHYSIFRPEVTRTHDGFRLVPDGSELLGELCCEYDAVIVAGEASSHCVAASLDHVIRFHAFYGDRPAKFYLLTDCMSPVVVPGADFTDQAEAALKRCADAGMHLVRSTTPTEEWPDFPPT